jgi:hypothetical protein
LARFVLLLHPNDLGKRGIARPHGCRSSGVTGERPQGEKMSFDSPERYRRHARMPIRSIVLISMGALSWVTEVENISATGLLVLRPDDWTASAGERCVLDLLVGEDLHIHLEANVTRVTTTHLGFAYTNIPESKEHALWGLLGQFADHVDQPDESPGNE